jgi:hypothetical protein
MVADVEAMPASIGAHLLGGGVMVAWAGLKDFEAEGIREFQQIVSQGISDSYLRWRGIDATLFFQEFQRIRKWSVHHSSEARHAKSKAIWCSRDVSGSFCLPLMSYEEKRRRESYKLNSHSYRHKNETPSRDSALLFEPRDERCVAVPMRRSKYPCLFVSQNHGPCRNARSNCGDQLAEKNQNDRDLFRTHGFLPLLPALTIAQGTVRQVGVMGRTLLLAWSGETSAISCEPIWVRRSGVAVMAGQGGAMSIHPATPHRGRTPSDRAHEHGTALLVADD